MMSAIATGTMSPPISPAAWKRPPVRPIASLGAASATKAGKDRVSLISRLTKEKAAFGARVQTKVHVQCISLELWQFCPRSPSPQLVWAVSPVTGVSSGDRALISLTDRRPRVSCAENMSPCLFASASRSVSLNSFLRSVRAFPPAADSNRYRPNQDGFRHHNVSRAPPVQDDRESRWLPG